MTGLDFETAVGCGIPITTIVLNNSSGVIERRGLAHPDASLSGVSARTMPSWAAPWADTRNGSTSQARSSPPSNAPDG